VQVQNKHYVAGNTYVLVLGAALLKALSLIYVAYPLGWFAFSLLFLALFNSKDFKKAFRLGLVFGLVSSLVLNYWMVPVVQRYAQGSMVLGITCLLLTAAVMALVYGGQFALYARLRFSAAWKYHSILNGLLLAALWVLAEWLRMKCFAGIPSLNYAVGISQASHLYLLQPAAWGSVYILSFSLVLANYFLALALYTRQWKWLAVPLVLFVFHFTTGYWAYQHLSAQTARLKEPPVKTALVLASLSPEAVWDAKNGPALVQQLLALNQQAIDQEPDFVLWSETIVPWTYAADDDFLQALIRPAPGRNSHYLVGMNTAAASGNRIHNSAYLLNPAGQVQARYDKQQLLTVVEQALFQEESPLILPFLAGSGLKMQPGAQAQALPTPWGKAGVLICNESVIPASTRAYAQSGVSFLINLGNDSWFSNSYFPRQHFYNGRLRAVEARKDLVINNNLGISGLIRANGQIAAQFRPSRGEVQLVEIRPNHLKANDPGWFISLMLGLALLLILARLVWPQPVGYLPVSSFLF
jgi:apolipoprotein N-acyltransferase